MAPPRKSPGRPPLNKTRGTVPAPASTAATEPMAGAFYSPSELGGEPVPYSAPEPTLRAGFKTQFTDDVRSGAVPLERGGSVDREVAEFLAEQANENPDDLAAEIARIRGIRKPIGAYTQKLELAKRKGYHRHWFNDTAGRIESAESNGWTHVKGSDGKPIARCVGTGRDKGALYAYAMEIPEVFWLEDIAARNRAASERFETVKKEPFRSPKNSMTSADRGKFYDPNESSEGPVSITHSIG